MVVPVEEPEVDDGADQEPEGSSGGSALLYVIGGAGLIITMIAGCLIYKFCLNKKRANPALAGFESETGPSKGGSKEENATSLLPDDAFNIDDDEIEANNATIEPAGTWS